MARPCSRQPTHLGAGLAQVGGEHGVECGVVCAGYENDGLTRGDTDSGGGGGAGQRAGRAGQGGSLASEIAEEGN